MAANASFMARLRNAGIDPADCDDTRISKSLLIFATGLVSLTSMLWLALYWSLGPRLSSTLPFAFQLLLVGNLALYLRGGNFALFRTTQLGLFLFFPFVAQWSIGNFITGSGIVLWGLLAPIGAILCVGVRESLGWFVGYVFLLVLTGGFDYFLADVATPDKPTIPVATSLIFFALNFIAVSTLVFLLLRFSIQEKQKIQLRLQDAHRLLQLEQEKSERLLLNILPGPVAERLKRDECTIADGFADVTVMFADIVNFTQVAAGMSPAQVFAMLNQVFSSFDEMAEHYGLEKIKTIGDAYMIAGGLNDANHEYSSAIAHMALDMCDWLDAHVAELGLPVQLRIGIGTGPVVAGVVGKKKFIYDLWGDTVNLASRITSEGAPRQIQADEATWLRLRDQFEFDPPFTLDLKGKGHTRVYRLQARRGTRPQAITMEPAVALAPRA